MIRTIASFLPVIALSIAAACLCAQEQPRQVVARITLKSPKNKEKPIFAKVGERDDLDIYTTLKGFEL